MSNFTFELESKIASYTDQKIGVAVGRAAWGISLTLRCFNAKLSEKNTIIKPKIALPAFLCQSPLGAIIAENWEPIFCDIDLDTAMVPLHEWERVIQAGANAILLVHMFGNPDTNIQSISDLCKKNNVYLLEDACLALGAHVNGRPCGSWGDAAFFSLRIGNSSRQAL